ncbi:MAG: hypothetical protein IJ129_04285 [Ruminococcus sp.]|nr:hypothetical protein [Ruminococcus sp.]
MGLFDDLNKAGNTSKGEKTVVFDRLPDTAEDFKALPQAQLADPFDTAAMAVLAFCYYPKDRAMALEMLNFLKGPRPLSPMEEQFIRDRFMDKDYVPRSYFAGAVPSNDYAPSQPYSVTVRENPYSYADEGYAKLFVTSGGADSPRSLVMRKAKDGKWYLWEQYILADIRPPESSDPWA